MEDPRAKTRQTVTAVDYETAVREGLPVPAPPELRAEACYARMGGRPATEEEFQRYCGDLPAGPD